MCSTPLSAAAEAFKDSSQGWRGHLRWLRLTGSPSRPAPGHGSSQDVPTLRGPRLPREPHLHILLVLLVFLAEVAPANV